MIFMDDAKVPSTSGKHTSAISHLFSQPGADPEELHSFAGKLGIPREAFKTPEGKHPHYAVTNAKRNAALEQGATSIRTADAARMILGPAAKAPAPKFHGSYESNSDTAAKPRNAYGSPDARLYPAGWLCDPHMPGSAPDPTPEPEPS